MVHFLFEKMASLAFELWAAGAFLAVLATSTTPSPSCPVAQGDSCHEVTFFLWTRLNPDEPQQVSGHNISTSYFNRTNPTKMVIHGYASGMNLEQLVNIRKEYLLADSFNLISPQYLELVDSPCYLTAVVNVDYVGKCIARFIRALDIPREKAPEPSGPSVLKLHLIGFSLGAQTTAFTAKHLKPDLVLDRITGLDPALPFFTTSNKDQKLSDDDALFVDAYHTNAYMQGQAEPCGQVDFYMNGGIDQPGCAFAGFVGKLKCNHHRAPIYFAESIRSDLGFWGWACSSISSYVMGRCPPENPAVLSGQWTDRRSKGSYVVETRSEEPFARGYFWRPSASHENTTVPVVVS